MGFKFTINTILFLATFKATNSELSCLTSFYLNFQELKKNVMRNRAARKKTSVERDAVRFCWSHDAETDKKSYLFIYLLTCLFILMVLKLLRHNNGTPLCDLNKVSTYLMAMVDVDVPINKSV